jgi:hypothetical protein
MAQPIPPVDPTTPDYGIDTGDYGAGTGDRITVPASSVYQQDGGGQSAVEETKNQAGQVSQSAADAGQHVAQVAKDQLGTVVGEAGRRSKDLLEQSRTELTQQAGQQQQRVAGGLQTLSKELHSMSNHEGESGLATDLAQQGADKIGELASWLEDREPGQLVGEVTAFARRRPGTFLLLAAGLGLAAGRLTRGVAAASSSDQSGSGGQSGSVQISPVQSAPIAPPAGSTTEFLATPQPSATFEDLPTAQSPGAFDDLSAGRLQ